MKHNQLLVVRYISVIRDDERYWCSDLLAEGKGWQRRDILTTKVRICTCHLSTIQNAGLFQGVRGPPPLGENIVFL